MIARPFWLKRILARLTERNVLWLAGVRRAGKTTLCRQLPDARFFDCELPRTRRLLEDPELFFADQQGRLVVLDEIHRLANPSEVLKIAADHFPRVRVVATGSSTLAARRKFKDTLTGRKRQVWLLPATLADMRAYGMTDWDERMLKGGLPPFLLGEGLADEDYLDWIDAFWAKDLQELFGVDKKGAFTKFMELVFHQSGQLFEATRFAAECEVSRQTIQHYLEILETTLVANVLRPFAGTSAAELKRQPKVYAFDTGFVCYIRDWGSLRPEDRGQMLEHLVLNELCAHLPRERLFYWRDKQQHEVDFVVKPGRSQQPMAIECKAQEKKFDPAALLSFRGRHPQGRNLVVCLDCLEAHRKRFGDLVVEFAPFAAFDRILMACDRVPQTERP